MEAKAMAVVSVPVMPIRAEAKDASEMVTQGLAGEKVEILESAARDWVKIRCLWDDYEGWSDRKQLVHAESEGAVHVISAVNQTFVRLRDEAVLNLSMGSRLVAGLSPNRWWLGDDELLATGPIRTFDGEAVDLAERLMGVPYLWGGRSAFGLDCSGLLQLVCLATGRNLARDASDQIHSGEPISPSEAQRGDFAFFQNDAGAIIHVGILSASDEIVHAAGEVRRDDFRPDGIYNRGDGRRTHALAGIRRVSF